MVVRAQAISFSKAKSMSETDESDLQRRWNLMMNFWIDPKSIEDGIIEIQSHSMPDPLLSDIDFKNEMAWVWTTLHRFNFWQCIIFHCKICRKKIVTYFWINTLQGHLLVDRLLWSWDTISVSLSVLVVIGVILWFCHCDRFNELNENKN